LQHVGSHLSDAVENSRLLASDIAYSICCSRLT
jgi:hypothetical protein